MADASLTAVLGEAMRQGYTRWRAYALSLTRNAFDAEDVVQDAIEKTLEAEPEFPHPKAAHRYLFLAIRSSAFRLRRRYRREPLESGAKIDEPRTASTALALMLEKERHVDKQRLWARVHSALQELRPEYREAIELLVMRDPPLRLREAAEVQGVAVTTARYRLRAALRDLRAHLDVGGGEGAGGAASSGGDSAADSGGNGPRDNDPNGGDAGDGPP